MPALKNCPYKFALRHFMLLLVFACSSALADFKLEKLDSFINNESLRVDAQAVLEFDKEPQKALDSGVDLRIIFNLQLMRSRKWLWDTPIDDWKMLFSLHFHQLSGQYILAVPQSDRIQTYSSIERALSALASQLSFNLGYQKKLKNSSDLYLRARLSLDKEFLPAPLKLLALLTNDWELDSGWTSWALDQ